MFSKKIVDDFSEQVEQLKIEKKFDHLADALEYMIENEVYDFITYTNVSQFINKSLRDKLLIEYSDRKMIVDKEKKLTQNRLF